MVGGLRGRVSPAPAAPARLPRRGRGTAAGPLPPSRDRRAAAVRAARLRERAPQGHGRLRRACRSSPWTTSGRSSTLQRFLAAAVRLIDRYGGHLRQVATGDKGNLLVAFFGAPVSHEDDEERAVHCCLELLRLPGGPFRAGVTTGSVYCGEVGSDTRREYAVIGDSVNLAARLMQAADAGPAPDRPARPTTGSATAPSTTGSTPIAVKGKSGPGRRLGGTGAARPARGPPGGRRPPPAAGGPGRGGRPGPGAGRAGAGRRGAGRLPDR